MNSGELNKWGYLMNVMNALVSRKSVRAFLDKPVEIQLIQQILDGARHAPSGTNSQPWQVAVVHGYTKAKLDELLTAEFLKGTPSNKDYNYYPTQMTEEFKARRVACGLQLYGALGIERDDKEKRLKQWALNYSAFGAPVVLYFFADKNIEAGSFMDYGMFLQSIMLMAVELGLATCPQAALAEYPEIVKQTLGYDMDSILICGLAVGYEDKSAAVNNYRTPREEVDSFTKLFE